jgi:hypothetical protein
VGRVRKLEESGFCVGEFDFGFYSDWPGMGVQPVEPGRHRDIIQQPLLRLRRNEVRQISAVRQMAIGWSHHQTINQAGVLFGVSISRRWPGSSAATIVWCPTFALPMTAVIVPLPAGS